MESGHPLEDDAVVLMSQAAQRALADALGVAGIGVAGTVLDVGSLGRRAMTCRSWRVGGERGRHRLVVAGMVDRTAVTGGRGAFVVRIAPRGACTRRPAASGSCAGCARTSDGPRARRAKDGMASLGKLGARVLAPLVQPIGLGALLLG